MVSYRRCPLTPSQTPTSSARAVHQMVSYRRCPLLPPQPPRAPFVRCSRLSATDAALSPLPNPHEQCFVGVGVRTGSPARAGCSPARAEQGRITIRFASFPRSVASSAMGRLMDSMGSIADRVTLAILGLRCTPPPSYGDACFQQPMGAVQKNAQYSEPERKKQRNRRRARPG